MGRPRIPLAERMEKYTVPEPMSGCWLWTGALTYDGYGYIGTRPLGAGRRITNIRAHRLAYELRFGPIPDGLVIDHLCRVRCCVNPDHMEAVTQQENLWRSPLVGGGAMLACAFGHEWTKESTLVARINGRPMRFCLTCRS